MSLDIAVLDEADSPKAVVSLTLDEHWALLQQAKRMSLPLWIRMSDYYADADYAMSEVPALAAETTQLRAACRDSGLLAKLKGIEEILDTARKESRSVYVIAD